MNRKIITIILAFLLEINIVLALGVSQISPESLELLPGESGRFYFQIQSVAVPRDLNCIYGVEKETPLLIEFDEPTSVILAGNVKDVLATVNVPEGTQYGSYKINFCAHCAFGQEPPEGQSIVRFSTCGLDVNVDVVGERTRLNMPLPAKPYIMPVWLLVLIILAAIVLIAVLWWYVNERKKKRHHKK